MTWEILCGLITLISFFIVVGGILVRLTRTLAVLESAVRELKEYIGRQTAKNDYFYKEIARLDKAVCGLEDKIRFVRCSDENPV